MSPHEHAKMVEDLIWLGLDTETISALVVAAIFDEIGEGIVLIYLCAVGAE